MANRLARASSPYLLQHADNPVDWREWGDDAFAEAADRDVPVLLSIGYAACHWCHVMADESFSDPVLAGYLNAHFVAVKVDREERPDVDAVYMNAVQAMTGQGGWPLTAFLTPAGTPFYAGTYFPPQPRAGLPSFGQLLEAVTDTWVQRRGDVDESAAAIAANLGSGLPAGSGVDVPASGDLDVAVGVLAEQFDPATGGFGGAPKFPPSMVLEFLLRHHARTADRRALTMVELTCEQMARGGIYDQLGGGFARYSVDSGWVVPHFEKMLYDNALLLRVYTNWWRATGSSLAERVVRETAEFLLRDLRTPEGGFASALDADAAKVPGGPHTEGASYVWTPDELRAALGGDDGAWAASTFGVTAVGTFEHGASTLRCPADPPDVDRWRRVRAALLDVRSQRPQPARDDKVVTAWNGLAIAALAQAGAVFGEQRWVDAAVECADLLVRVHLDDTGRLRRASIDGRAGAAAGVLEDYGDLAEGFLALVAATGEATWLMLAEQLLDEALSRFVDDTTVFDTAADATDARLAAIGRPQDPTDNATPAGRSALAGALLSFAAYTGSARHRAAAEFALGAYRPLAVRAPRFAGWALAVAEALVAGPLEVAVVGSPDDERTAALAAAARRHLAAGAALVVSEPGSDEVSAIPLLRHRDLVDGAPAAYVCRHFACDRPATDPQTLVAQLAASS